MDTTMNITNTTPDPNNISAEPVTSIYGDRFLELQGVRSLLEDAVDKIRFRVRRDQGYDPVDHCLSRIKSEESMREKLRKKGLPETAESALNEVFDAVGIRIVCAFLDDVYMMRDLLKAIPWIEVVEEKDYIRHAKENGYRSLHLILKVDGKCYAEVQIRTVSMDTWAALEHKLRYKKNIGGNTALIAQELKRCADELAGTDSSMQTIRNMIGRIGE